MKKNILDLDIQLCHKLYAASNMLTRIYRLYLRDLGITYPQYLVFLVLWQKRRFANLEITEDNTLTEISSLSKIDKGSFTLIIKKLEEKKFVKISSSKKDSRVKFITLTKKGSSLEKQATTIPEKMSAHFSTMKKEDFLLLNELMNKFLQDIKE